MEQTRRSIQMGTSQMRYPSNEVKSTSSTIITFIPINLYTQLTSLANVYFILIAVLQMIPSVSVTGGKPTILVPLSIVMLTVLIKDAYEEYCRYCKDKEENEKAIQMWNGTAFMMAQTQSIRVGNVLRIKKDSIIPCDAVVIETSDLEEKCYVETKGLDGETNLKVKRSFLSRALPTIIRGSSSFQKPIDTYKQHCPIEVGPPSPYLQEFVGTVTLGDTIIPIDSQNLLLRACEVKNVEEVYCVCVYSGADTKVVLNGVKFAPKKGCLTEQINIMVVEIFFWQILIALFCGLLNMLFESSYRGYMPYLPNTSFWLVSLTWWLMMTSFIPISLMVTMEMVRLFQGSVLARDPIGYSSEYNCFANANNTSVNQNLGQIKFVFTDKTGTLTKNNMRFRMLYCNGKVYGEQQDEEDKELLRKLQTVDHVVFKDSSFRKDINHPKIQQFLKILVLCNQIYVNTQDGKFNSSSPDEIALANFAKLYNKELLSEEQKIITVAEGNKLKKYVKLAYFPFNSNRKRTSILVRDQDTNQIQLLMKGADNVVSQLLNLRESDLVETLKVVDRLSSIGLRTLLVASRSVSEEEYERWKITYSKAAKSIQNRENQLDECYKLIEKDMRLVGATAIEDELQDDVKDTIESMRCAGMTFFILTGDKRQTALSVGKAIGLVKAETKVYDIPSYSASKETEWLRLMGEFERTKGDVVYLFRADIDIPPSLPLHQTICYRCNPNTKQAMVKLYQQKSKELSMAVGDGANDVNMITAADVGVGIKGKEGSEAARVADFVVGQFKHIRLLTLYYGREWYRKNCRLVTYSLFKNWYHVFSVIAYGTLSYFSGVVIFNIYFYELINVFFTSWPIIAYAVFDEEQTYKKAIVRSEKYQDGIDSKQFNQTVYVQAIGLGVVYGIVSMLAIFCVLQTTVNDSEGRTGTLQQSGSVLFCNLIAIVNLRIFVMGHGLRPFTVIISLASIFFYWLVYWFYAFTVGPTAKQAFYLELTTPFIYIIHFIIIFFLIFIELAYRKYQQFLQIEGHQSVAAQVKNIYQYSLLP